MLSRRLLTGCLAGLVLLMSVGPALAATSFFAVMDGPTAGTPSLGVGTVTFVLNDARTEVTYAVGYSGLDGVEFAAHIHRGNPGEYGPVLTDLPLGSPKQGVWAVTSTQATLLEQGAIYVNIHTDLYPGGEIRGNLAPQTVAAETRSFGAVKALFQ